MSYAGLLTQRGDVYRPTYDTPAGPEAKATWSATPTTSSVPCLLQALAVKEQDKETGAVIATHRGYFAYGVDLLEKDRLIVDSVTYDVEGVDVDVAGAGHHAEALLKRVG